MTITGVSHIHSTVSYDGKVALSDIRSGFIEKGMRFALMAEHTDDMTTDAARALIEECRFQSDESFLFVPGFEVPFDGGHVIIIGATSFVERKDELDTIKEYVRKGALAVLAHPHRSNFEAPKELAKILFGIEVWNSQYDGRRVPRARSLKLLSDLREYYNNLKAIGGLDFHRWEHSDGPQIEMDVYDLTIPAVLEVLREGLYTVVGGNIRISPAGSVVGVSDLSLTMKSAFSITSVSVGKRAVSGLKKMRVPVPSGIKKWLRKHL